VAPRWAHSADKHGIPRADQIYALINATYKVELADERIDGGAVWLYIGPPHAQTDRELELLVNVYSDGREALVFHTMPLSARYWRYREENPGGN
jgi:hypothetical protein